MKIMNKGLLLGASLALLAASSNGALAQGGQSAYEAASNAVQNAVGSAIENARDSVYAMRDRALAARAPMRSRFSAEPTVEDAFAALGYAPRDPKSPMYTKAPVAAPAPATLVSIWGSVTGSSERRDFIQLAPLADLGSRSDSFTGLGGIDVVKSGIFTNDDAIILGALGGGTETQTSAALTRSKATSPTGGVYAAYLLGGFSTDASFTGIFTRSTAAGTVLPPFQNIETSTYVFANNYQYRFKMSDASWIEPTVGYSYTRNEIGATFPVIAPALIPATEIWRVQGGVRVGTETNWFGTRVQPSIYGGVYEDVSLRPAPLVANPASDINKLFAKGTAKLNFILSPNSSVYVMGEGHGRDGVIGYSGTGGFRYTF